VWHSIATKSGFDIAALVKIVNNIEHFNHEAREKALRYVAKHIHKALELQRELPTSTVEKITKFVQKGSFLLLVYLFTKLLFICNVVGQLFLLNIFLGNSYNPYGIEVVRKIFNTTALSFSIPASESPRFPRITMCHFQVRFLGDNIHDYVVQCALTVNLFNEKIFLLIWFWLMYVSIISIYGFCVWIWYSLWWSRLSLVKQYFKLIKTREKYDRKLLHIFCNHFLRQDGALVIRLIGQNSNGVIMGEIISAMWDYFRQSKDDGNLFI
jgi:innexin